jgi:pyrroloquinoline quinone biosynthesis protein D
MDGAIRPHIGAGFRLQWEPAQDCHVLLYPEGMVKLNQSAGEILKRCDGQRSLNDIVQDLEATFNAKGLAKDVQAFVEIAARQRWLQWD